MKQHCRHINLSGEHYGYKRTSKYGKGYGTGNGDHHYKSDSDGNLMPCKLSLPVFYTGGKGRHKRGTKGIGKSYRNVCQHPVFP